MGRPTPSLDLRKFVQQSLRDELARFKAGIAVADLHLSDQQVDTFLDGELSPEEQSRLMRHLLRGCSVCTARLGNRLRQIQELSSFAPEEPAELDEAYDRALDRAISAACRRAPELAAERSQASAALAALQASRGVPGEPAAPMLSMAPVGEAVVPSAGALEAVRGEGPAWVEVLLAESFAERYRNPQKMFEYAALARDAAEAMEPAKYGRAFAADWRAKAWGELANAYRVREDFPAAQDAFAVAYRHLEAGTGDPLLLARLQSLEASLLADRRRFVEACDLLAGVVDLYQMLGETHLVGRTFVKLGIYTDYAGRPQRGLELLRQGLPLLDADSDQRLTVTATEVFLGLLVEDGHYREAARLLLESGLRKKLADEPLNLLKLRWIEGQVFAGLGKLARAEEAFEAVREGFLLARQEYTAALVGLDLAAVLLEGGKGFRVRELAQDVLTTFRALGIRREAQRALDFLTRACRQERTNPAMLRHVGRFLKRLEREPHLRFQVPRPQKWDGPDQPSPGPR